MRENRVLLPTLPCQTVPVVNVTTIQKLGWLPSVLSFVQFIGLAALSTYTFSRTRADKTTERRAAWFQKVVVDEALESIPEFTRRQLSRLKEAAERYHEQSKGATPDDAENTISEALNDFQVDLSSTTSSMLTRLTVFDRTFRNELSNAVDEYEHSVSKWFELLPRRKPYEACDSLPQLVTDGQARILALLYEFEFAKLASSKRLLITPKSKENI